MHHRFRNVLVLLCGAGLIMVVAHLGRIPGTPPPVDLPGDPQCKVSVVATQGVPPPDDADRLARRIQRFCDLNNGPAPPADQPSTDRVNAREFCLRMADRGQGMTRDDCAKIPADSTYYYHH
jgi:hypothetical protein